MAELCQKLVQAETQADVEAKRLEGPFVRRDARTVPTDENRGIEGAKVIDWTKRP
jgi:hypothetical protein